MAGKRFDSDSAHQRATQDSPHEPSHEATDSRSDVPTELAEELRRLGIDLAALPWPPSDENLVSLRLLVSLQPVANAARKLWEHFPDDELCDICGRVPDDAMAFIPTLALEVLSQYPPEIDPELTDDEARELLTILFAQLSFVLAMSLAEEFNRRTLANETPVGAIARKTIANRGVTLTTEDLKTLTRLGQRRRYNPDGREETDAMYLAAFVEQARDVAEALRTAPLDEQFRQVMSNAFSAVGHKADSSVRDQVRRTRKRSRREITLDDCHESATGSATGVRGDKFNVPFEWGSDVEQQVLLAEVVSDKSLTDRERVVLELRLQGLTQPEIAKQFDISQPRVAQIERQAIQKIGSRVRPPGE